MNAYLLDAIRHNNTMPLWSLKKLLWKDESGDVFIITRGAEIYLQTGYKPETIGAATIRLLVWSQALLGKLRASGVVIREKATNDDFYILDCPLASLPAILEMQPQTKNRPHLRGSFITGLERRLGHQILPYNPALES